MPSVNNASPLEELQFSALACKLDAAMRQLDTIAAAHRDDDNLTHKFQDISETLLRLRSMVENHEQLLRDAQRTDTIISRILRLEKGLDRLRQQCALCGAAEDIEKVQKELTGLKELFDQHALQGLTDSLAFGAVRKQQEARQAFARKVGSVVVGGLLLMLVAWVAKAAIMQLLGVTP